jgi:glycosyltransferase involved in cell wall biosynthesis
MAGQTRQLAELLTSEGAVVSVIQVNPPYRPRCVASIRGVRAVFRLVPYLGRLWRAAADVDLFHVMANSGWSWQLLAAPAVWIGRLRGVPVVVNYRGGGADAFLSKSLQFVKPTLARASALAVPSGFLQEVFARYGFASTVLPNVVDTMRFSPIGPTADRPGTPHLVVARNLEAIYDVGAAIGALARVRSSLPAASLSIAGTGPELPALIALAQSLGVATATRFTGRLERDEMAALYRSADVVLNPSRVDNMPNSVLEALACGVPVVSTDVGGLPYIVQDRRTAMLVQPGNNAAMADAVIDLIRERPRAEALAQAGLAEVQRYTWPKVRGVLANLYHQALLRRSAEAA